LTGVPTRLEWPIKNGLAILDCFSARRVRNGRSVAIVGSGALPAKNGLDNAPASRTDRGVLPMPANESMSLLLLHYAASVSDLLTQD
jgi:hypothetical protein